MRAEKRNIQDLCRRFSRPNARGVVVVALKRRIIIELSIME